MLLSKHRDRVLQARPSLSRDRPPPVAATKYSVSRVFLSPHLKSRLPTNSVQTPKLLPAAAGARQVYVVSKSLKTLETKGFPFAAEPTTRAVRRAAISVNDSVIVWANWPPHRARTRREFPDSSPRSPDCLPRDYDYTGLLIEIRGARRCRDGNSRVLHSPRPRSCSGICAG